MDVSVALDGSKERNLIFSPGDDTTINLIVYAHDGDTDSITPTDFMWSTGGGAFFPVGQEFTFPCVNRTRYTITALVAGVRTTLVYGVIDAPYPCFCAWYCGCDGIFPAIIPTGEAANIIVQDSSEYFVAKNVEDVLQEIGEQLQALRDAP